MNNRKLLSIVGASTVAVSIIAGGIITVSAQEGAGTPTPAASQRGPHNGSNADSDSDMARANGTMGEPGARPQGMGENKGEHAEGMGMHGGKAGMNGSASPESLATFLGVDVPTLQAARQEGKSLATIAQENGKSREDLKAFILAEAKAHLDEEVASGEHTQEEADQKLAGMAAQVDALIDGTGPGAGIGPRGDHGGMSPEGMSGAKERGQH